MLQASPCVGGLSPHQLGEDPVFSLLSTAFKMQHDCLLGVLPASSARCPWPFPPGASHEALRAPGPIILSLRRIPSLLGTGCPSHTTFPPQDTPSHLSCSLPSALLRNATLGQVITLPPQSSRQKGPRDSLGRLRVSAECRPVQGRDPVCPAPQSICRPHPQHGVGKLLASLPLLSTFVQGG